MLRQIQSITCWKMHSPDNTTAVTKACQRKRFHRPWVRNWPKKECQRGGVHFLHTSRRSSNWLNLGFLLCCGSRVYVSVILWIFHCRHGHIPIYPVTFVMSHNILCVTLKLFFLSFVPLLAPNPGDASRSTFAAVCASEIIFFKNR